MPMAVVTGGAQGIGRACVVRFLGEGWRVVVLDRDAEAVADLRRKIGGEALLALEADCGSQAAVSDAFAALARWSDGAAIDLLFNNAGIADPDTGPVESLSLDAFRRHLDSGLVAAFLATRAAVPALRRARGAIVNMASTRALQSEPNSEAYAATKGGILAMTHALAVSLGPDVRVNAVAPGWIDSASHAKASARHAPQHTKEDHAQHPAGRIGTPEDVAAAVAYLASPAAGFVTGETLVLDGGMTRRMIYAD